VIILAVGTILGGLPYFQPNLFHTSVAAGFVGYLLSASGFPPVESR
jgi:hypothetical protein